jgi:hypothetical protein
VVSRYPDIFNLEFNDWKVAVQQNEYDTIAYPKEKAAGNARENGSRAIDTPAAQALCHSRCQLLIPAHLNRSKATHTLTTHY